MSSDDYVGIVKRRNKYYGFLLCASESVPKLKDLPSSGAKFQTDTIEEAILKGQAIHTEYGIQFLNLKSNGEKIE